MRILYRSKSISRTCTCWLCPGHGRGPCSWRRGSAGWWPRKSVARVPGRCSGPTGACLCRSWPSWHPRSVKTQVWSDPSATTRGRTCKENKRKAKKTPSELNSCRGWTAPEPFDLFGLFPLSLGRACGTPTYGVTYAWSLGNLRVRIFFCLQAWFFSNVVKIFIVNFCLFMSRLFS